MIIVLTLILMALGIVCLFWRFGDKADVVIASIVSSVIIAVIIVASLGGSYDAYLTIRTQYEATIAQYKGAITMYDDKVHIDVEKAALVDFRYKGYQDNMARFIKDLRHEIIKYNKQFISKRIMDNNPIFSWLVVGPDKDMKVINMVE